TQFVDELQHPQQRYHHGKPSEAAIYAGVIGIGCAIGLRRMMRISRGISEAELEHTVNWHFTLDGLNPPSDRLLRLLGRLAVPTLTRRLPDQLHTSSDGQKFEVRVDSLNANYSFKYFGKEQGVAAYTFRDERDLLWYSTVFSAAERESAYVIDGLMHNEVVKSDIHSTDAFGFSELVFAVSHLLGFSYAPRFKNLQRQRLYIFKSRKRLDRSTWKIKPAGYADDEIVIQQWDEILRMIATIKLKEVTASDLFRRLNSYSKQHALYPHLLFRFSCEGPSVLDSRAFFVSFVAIHYCDFCLMKAELYAYIVAIIKTPLRLHLEIQRHRANPVGIIRSSYRSEGKVKHSNHGRITGLSLDQLKVLQAAFRGDVVLKGSPEDFQLINSREYGASRALLELAKQLGLDRALYSRNEPWVRDC